METETKKWWESKSIWSCIVMFITLTVAFVADPAVGIVSPGVALAFSKWLTGVALGLGVAGRLTATKPIK